MRIDSSASELLFCVFRIAPVIGRILSRARTQLACAGRSTRRSLGCFLAAAALAIASIAHGQPEPTTPSTSKPNSVSSQPDALAPAAIPLVEVAVDAESASARVRDVQTALAADHTTETVAKQLPLMTREIDARLRENRNIVAQRPSIEMLGNLEAGWWRLGRNLYGWTWDLTRRATKLEEQIAEMDEIAGRWERTLELSRNSEAPPEVVQRIRTVIAETKEAREAIEKRRARVLTMQNRVAVQEGRIADVLRTIAEARDEVLERLFLKDSDPIWSAEMASATVRDLLEESENSFVTQSAALGTYSKRETVRFLIHLTIFLALAAALYRVKHRLRSSLTEEGERRIALVFDSPIAAALLLSVLCIWWFYPDPPRLVAATLLGLALIPSVIILRRLIESDLHPGLYAGIFFYLMDQVRALTAGVEVLPRLLFLAEMIAGMLFLIWLIRATGRPFSSASETARLRKTIKVAAWIALALAGIAFAANIVGYVTLANLVGSALVRSALLALILYAAVEVLDGLIAITFGMRPLALLSTVNQHRPLVRRRIRYSLKWAAILVWVLDALDRLLLRDRMVSAVSDVLTAQLEIGSLRIALGDVLAFALTVWAAFVVSRFVRFLLEEDVYPRVRLKRGLPYAISTMLHYLILVVGFFVAVAALGFDMTKVTILAGAFSVGVGFGLQNIFNNFVSGIILLFERPVKVGDVVQIEDASGVVERIGIRASIIRTTSGSEVIVPNGKLISERVINWTLSNRQHSIELPITVAQNADPSRVITLLERTAAAHPLVTGDPPPQALVVKLGPDSLGFELRAWTDHIEKWLQIRSELAITISSALAAENIAMR
jgi:potassium-dependent mechanosensitive channel